MDKVMESIQVGQTVWAIPPRFRASWSGDVPVEGVVASISGHNDDYVVVVFPDHTHVAFSRRLNRVYGESLFLESWYLRECPTE